MASFGARTLAAADIALRSGTGLALAIREGVLAPLHPRVNGHTVVIPAREIQGTLAALTDAELREFAALLVLAGDAAIATHSRATTDDGTSAAPTSYNLLIKDGVGAGRPPGFPLHAHLVPRYPGDLAQDQVFQLLDAWTPVPGVVNTSVPKTNWPADQDRRNRTAETMAAEASRYAEYAAANGLAGGDRPIEELGFGQWTASPQQVFYKSATALSYASVNLRPLVPGHVLVISTRKVPRLRDLTAAELEDLWLSVQRVQAIVNGVHGATANDIGLQDGPDAGQSVPHVHIHVLPRK